MFPPSSRVAPVFHISCVTGHNLPLLQKFLYLIPVETTHELLSQQPAEFHVDELFNVEGVGLVLGGILRRGTVQEGEVMLIGPMARGEFTRTVVRSIRFRINRAPCQQIVAGQAATITVAGVDRTSVRKVRAMSEVTRWLICSPFSQGTVLLSEAALNEAAHSCSEFDVELQLLYCSNSCVRKGFQATVYVASIMQNAVIDVIHDKVTGRLPSALPVYLLPYLSLPTRTPCQQGRRLASGVDFSTTLSSCGWAVVW